MRVETIPFAIPFLAAATAFGQAAADPNVSKVLHFNFVSGTGMTEMVTMIRTVADVPNLTVDANAKTVSMSGRADRVAMAEWLFSELDRPVQPNQAQAVYEYRVPGSSDYVTKVIYLANLKTATELTELVRAMGMVADVQRLFPFQASQAIVMRAEADRVAMAEWICRELDQPGQPNKGTTDHQAPMTLDNGQVARIFYAAHINTTRSLMEAVTTIRALADVQRVFPFQSGEALIMRGPAPNVALSEWLFHQLDQPGDGQPPAPQGPDQFQLPGAVDGVAKVFYLVHTDRGKGLIDVATAIRATVGVQRIFPFSALTAVVARGTAAQIAEAGQLIQARDKAVQ